ncbi:MAG: hypothetical protein A2029_10520 [Chloroflexi bacterium RBG_19FT_COMBO_47_9]|nr:MAG: hypothetical protein A2Y53_06320 [Chloroflexi bacterium RBG_16_47_49]OGO60738.1 MAG: hypothetical protein A2029_10520 [Chloroflexi bacterium RBG_19FT_COMBO_47_9]
MKPKFFTRRDFLKAAGVTMAAGVVIGLPGCAPALEATEAAIKVPTKVPTEAPAAVTHGKKLEAFQAMTTTASGDPRRFEISRMTCDAWKALGIPAEQWPVASTVMVEQAWDDKKYQVYFIHHDPNPDRMEPDTWLYKYYYSGNAGPTGSNISGYSNPEYDALAVAQREETDVTKRKELVDQCQAWLYDAQPYHITTNLHLAGVYNKTTFGDPTIFVGNPVYNFWSIKTFKPLTDQKVLRIGLARDFDSINPMAASNPEDIQFLSLIYDMVGRVDPEGKPVPWIAKSIDAISASEYEVTVREGLTWHDGVPLTAEDVAFTFNYAKANSAVYFASGLAILDKAEVVAPDKVKFTLTSPFVPFISNVLCAVFILPKHIWENISNPLEIPNEQPIGSGPWKFDYMRTMEESKLVRNPDHFEPALAEGVLHVVYGSVDGMLGALEAGDIDTVGEILTIAQVDQLQGLPHIQIEKVTEFGMEAFYCNTRLEPFNDKVFRNALALSQPTPDIIKVVLRGAGDPGGSIIAPSLKFWHNNNLPAFPYDPEKAKQSLLDAGYTWDEEGNMYYPTPENDKRVIDTGLV